MSDDGEIVDVPLVKLVYGPVVRAKVVNYDHVLGLRPVLHAVPPIVVRQRETGNYEVIDGRHRWEAAKDEACETIRAVVMTMTDEEALEAAVAANLTHGLPLSVSERKAVAAKMIDLTDWADRRIGVACGIAPTTVASLRPKCPTVQTGQLDTREGADGRQRPASPAAARERVADLARANPAASARDLGKQAGVSPTTAADVVKRIGAGESPVPPKLQAAPDLPPDEGTTMADAMGLVPTVWHDLEACRRSDQAQSFGLFMDRFTRWNGKPFAKHRAAAECPAELRTHAASLARSMAAEWTQLATDLEAPVRLTEAVS